MGSTYHTPVFIGLLCVMCFAAVLLLHHCVLLVCRRRRRHRLRGPGTGRQQQQGEEAEDEDEEAGSRSSVDMSSSRTHLVKGAVAPPPVVCPYRKGEEAWGESTCPVCLADFADGEPVRVLPECMHYFHGECIDTWLRGGSSSCPMCRAETTPTPTPSPGELQHHDLSASGSASLEDILVRT